MNYFLIYWLTGMIIALIQITFFREKLLADPEIRDGTEKLEFLLGNSLHILIVVLGGLIIIPCCINGLILKIGGSGNAND